MHRLIYVSCVISTRETQPATYVAERLHVHDHPDHFLPKYVIMAIQRLFVFTDRIEPLKSGVCRFSISVSKSQPKFAITAFGEIYSHLVRALFFLRKVSCFSGFYSFRFPIIRLC